MNKPLVSIICICHNHAEYVIESLKSAAAQTYNNIEIIVADDGSSDSSIMQINKFCSSHPEVKTCFEELPIGNCKLFNKALKLAKGDYVIDLAADDFLLPNRVEKGIERFVQIPAAGVNYCLSRTIGPDDQIRDQRIAYPREGDVYDWVLKKHMISPPSLMIRKLVLDEMGGYDETLAYEDFDLYIRAARNWEYCFTNDVLVVKRILPTSKSASIYDRRSVHLRSTLAVLNKAYQLNKNTHEDWNLFHRALFESWAALKKKRYWMSFRFSLVGVKALIWPITLR